MKKINCPNRKKGIRYHPLLLRYATVLKIKLKGNTYYFLAQKFGYSSTVSLNRYNSLNWKDGDGVCHKILESKRYDLKKSNKSLGRLYSR